MYFTDRVILAASRCIEEHKLNLDCNLPVSIASPDHFRCEFYNGGIFSKLLQSVFPLFIAFVRIVSAVFCRCPCTAVCTCICLLLTVQLPSLCQAIFSLLRRFFLSSSSSLFLNFKPPFSLERSFGGKSSPARIYSHLCLLFCVICIRNRS